MNWNSNSLKNFWFYYKKHILIGLAVVFVGFWLILQRTQTVSPDYHIGLVRETPLSQEELLELENTFLAAAEDVNGDGEIRVQIHTYWVNLADDSENAGVTNADTIQALDADLIGGVSGIFLLEDVDTFRAVTNDLPGETCIPFRGGLYLTLRRDAPDCYLHLAEKLF